ncbi:hypothetical protein MVES1_000611 [Malassezia vespertilionis]|uniref:uncharacterized protein n=1 Tax=Malassezia vespertilionis TaxID=2020962 RepID=UPI0024B0D598|nr:uncharacterized protein MVES1_000611 [Malassezia vespertilionis]WFD05282.1 hypothetical protein MVES1_000611 [Malassezia vespertilionis]
MSVNATPESSAANKQRRDDAIRDEWIKVMQVRLVREELQKCYRAEGENHYMVCAPIVKIYDDLLKDAKVKGYRTVDL